MREISNAAHAGPFATDESARAHVYAWAYRLLRNHHDALDATQEVLLRDLQAPTREIRCHAAWLRRVTVNHCLDQLRARRNCPTPTAAAHDDHGPERFAAAHELRDAVVRGLETLSDQQRAVLVAKVYDQETFAAIAHSMGLAVPTIKTHYVRALAAMRRCLRPHAELDG